MKVRKDSKGGKGKDGLRKILIMKWLSSDLLFKYHNLTMI